MKKEFLFTITVLMLFSQIASAQFVGMNRNTAVSPRITNSSASSFEARNTIHASYSPLKMVVSDGSESESEKMTGFNVGWDHLCPLSTANLFFEYGLSLAMGFDNDKGSSYESKTILMDLRAPLSLSYLLQLSNIPVGIMPVAGLDLGAYIVGKSKLKIQSKDWEEYDIFDSDSEYKRFILDFHVGARVLLGQKLYIEYRYEGPITPLVKEDEIKGTVRRHNIGLGVFF